MDRCFGTFNAVTRRSLSGSASLVDVERTKGWRRKLPAGVSFSLRQDETEVASVATGWRSADLSFKPGATCRFTRVSFEDGSWLIRTRGSGRQADKRVLGFRRKDYSQRADRIVEVLEDGRQIAHLVNPDNRALRLAPLVAANLVALHPYEVMTASGESIALRHQFRRASGDMLTIKVSKGDYLFETTHIVPLEAALLHWHIMRGDFRDPPSDGGGGE